MESRLNKGQKKAFVSWARKGFEVIDIDEKGTAFIQRECEDGMGRKFKQTKRILWNGTVEHVYESR